MSMKLENKIKLVNEGKSKIFNNWTYHAGVTKDKFIEALKWLEEDPMTNVTGVKRLSREIGCKANGELIHGKRVYLKNGEFCRIYPEDTNLTLQDFPKVSINKLDWI